MWGAQGFELAEAVEPLPAPRASAPALRQIKIDIRASFPTIATCCSAPELRAWLLKFSRDLGFYGARYVHIGTRWWSHEHAETPVRFLSTSDRSDDRQEDWLARDPNVAGARSGFAPFAWSTRIVDKLSDVQRLWLERERLRGVACGVAIPVQDSIDGPAYLSLFGYDEAGVHCLVQEQAPELAFAAAQYHAVAKRLIDVGHWTPKLSRREIECLRLAAAGRTIRESGDILGVSNRTVEYHLQKAMVTLGAQNKIRAVVIAFGSGLAHV